MLSQKVTNDMLSFNSIQWEEKILITNLLPCQWKKTSDWLIPLLHLVQLFLAMYLAAYKFYKPFWIQNSDFNFKAVTFKKNSPKSFNLKPFQISPFIFFNHYVFLLEVWLNASHDLPVVNVIIQFSRMNS